MNAKIAHGAYPRKPTRRAATARLGAIEYDILDRLSVGDLLYGALLSACSTRLMFKLARERAQQRYRTKRAIDRLVSQGFLAQKNENLALRNPGRHALEVATRVARARRRPAQWDGKWRIVSYDIPEKQKSLRDAVRVILKRTGFIELHHSLWVFPYDCAELASFIKRETRLGANLIYGTLEAIENDAYLRMRFGLRGGRTHRAECM